ncbi:MAG: DinB family protein [Bacteroidetes bacterium]|nr:MAG: DinB family protein [Bacteroidota bacterium]
MSVSQEVEFWMKGPVDNVPSLLQPVAHTLLQMRKEVSGIMGDFPPSLLWEKPSGLASPAFHLQHIPGVLDRLFTYARNEPLSTLQFKALGEEGRRNDDLTITMLLDRLSEQVEISLEQLRNTNESSLTDSRGVGRKQLPSTVIGLLFHAAEHCMRHTGQLLVTAGILRRTMQ